jgi:hypothetical protein
VNTNFNTIGTRKLKPVNSQIHPQSEQQFFFLNLQCCGDQRDWMLDKMKNLFPIKTQKERKKENEQRT